MDARPCDVSGAPQPGVSSATGPARSRSGASPGLPPSRLTGAKALGCSIERGRSPGAWTMSMRPYIVRQGDYLTKLARALGSDADGVWGHEQNRALREQRPTPDILHPGDVLHVPAPALATGPAISPHPHTRYRARVPAVEIKIRL